MLVQVSVPVAGAGTLLCCEKGTAWSCGAEVMQTRRLCPLLLTESLPQVGAWQIPLPSPLLGVGPAPQQCCRWSPWGQVCVGALCLSTVLLG